MVSLSCGHCYCYNCQFRPPLLKIQCRQCRERTGLVIENQLRLLVQCYKHMCHVLAAHMKQSQSEPSKNDAVAASSVVPDAVVKMAQVDCNAAKMDTAAKAGTESDPTISNAVGTKQTGTESGSCDSLVGGEGKEKQSAPVVTELDPIGQILREVQNGEKVSRAVLMIKPPAKYLNVRVSTPKKDHSSHSQKIAAAPVSVKSSKSTKLHSISRSPENDTLSANKADEQSETSSAAKSAGKSKKSKKPFKQQADPDPSRQLSSAQSTPDRKVRVQHGTLKKHKKEVNAIDVSYPDNEITKAKFSDILLPPEDWEVKSNCLDKDHVIVTSSGIEMNNDAPPLLEQSPSSPEPPWLRAGFKRSRSPLSPRLYDTKRRKIPMVEKRQQCSTTSPGGAAANVVMEEQNLGKEEQSSAETPKNDSAGSTPVQSGGEVTPSPAKQRRKTPSGTPRCRCGTNHPQVLQKICARGKCPCFSQGKPCNRCLCRNCHNPYQLR